MDSTRIIRLGEVARSCLSNGQAGRVEASVSKALYMVTDAGELFWLAAPEAPMHRRGALVAGMLPHMPPGSRFYVENDRLVAGPAGAVDISDASIWRAATVPACRAVPVGALASRAGDMFNGADLAAPEGFGVFIPWILSSLTGRDSTRALDSAEPLLEYARPLVLGAAEACRTRQIFLLQALAERIVGLGAGLTPSGDDFLGGMLFAMKQLRAVYPVLNWTECELPVESYQGRTNLISFTLLGDLARGHAIAPLHSILNGLIAGDPPACIRSSIVQLSQVGHSTGWDLLAGLLTGLLSLVPRKDLVVPFIRIAQNLES